MRRTYRSKKDAGGALDHKDILLTMDEKSSAFDAFYIQNIKQTKREMSTVNFLAAPPSKVRKRKYVKRIIKDQEPQKEPVLDSVCLTPNKSLHVNKPLDPFDQLLNSSSTHQSDSLKVNKGGLFGYQNIAKTYRKKVTKLKKYNYSSSDTTESDKENSDYNKTPDTSNIKKHELLIEKNTKKSPIFLDESIKDLVQNFSLLKKTSPKTPGKVSKPFKLINNRLTTNIQSPKLQNSPLCSTPFKEKYRGKSIYNFSPITCKVLNDTLDMSTSPNKSNDSIIFVPNKKRNLSKKQELSLSEVCKSPVFKTPNYKAPTTSMEDSKEITINRYTLCEVDPEIALEPNNRSIITDDKVSTELQEHIAHKECVKSDEVPCIEISSLQTTEIEPFMGFSNNEYSLKRDIGDDIVSLHRVLNEELLARKLRNSDEITDDVPSSSVKLLDIQNNSEKSQYNHSLEDSVMLFSNDNPIGFEINEECSSGKPQEEKSLDDSVMLSESLEETDAEVRLNEENNISQHSSHKFVDSEIESEVTQHLDNSVMLSEPLEDIDPETSISNEENNISEHSSYKSSNNKIESEITQSLDNSVMLSDPLEDTDSETNISNRENNISEHSFYKYSDNKIECAMTQSLDNSVMLSEPLVETDPETNRSNEENNISQHSYNKSSDSQIDSETSQLQNITLDQQSFLQDSFVANDVCENSEELSLSQNYDNQSLYDTCDSGDTSQDNSEIYYSNKLPVVEIERLDDSVFQKYYSKMSEYDENSQNCQDSEDYESVDNISDLSNKSNESTGNSENVNESSDSDFSKDMSDTNDSDSNSNTDEDRCISFVTTRRRNEVTNDSMILAFNDSYGSISSVECDKTVLSNNRNSNGKSDLNDNEATLVNNKTDSPSMETFSLDISRPDIIRMSNVVTRNSARERESLINNELKDEFIEPRPSIVLQPGKKWERSLSIYRRMTMMNDHFDHSVLEDEPMLLKGRKYRQSVISTMEMQDKSILHNESLNSRRSTFVSKPCRSTIKIVKEPNNSRISLCSTPVLDDLKGFLNEDCDDTIVELSKLSIADSEHEVTVLENFHDSAGRIATARDYVLRRCNQTEVLLFDECYPDTVLKNCHKIGEGVYGEVFLWRARDGRARVMKIVPIAGNIKVNGESQKDFHEIISEIVIAMELSALRAPIAEIDRHFDEGKDIDALDLHSVENATDVFNEVLSVKCVYGSYPSRLLDLWELYDECKGSENDSPAILPADQQYIVLELANAGQDLESYQFNSAEQAHALFLQVAFALAVGEESFQFEHRDLHWGNVLIAPTDQKFATFVLRGRAHRVARCGVAATIIDYSLSRISLPLSHADCAALYNDLAADDGLFDALGDYQFEVYRRMRDKLGNDWKNFEPYTNILWLHYTVDKMITALRYKRTNTKIHKHYIAKLKGIKNRILDYGSAVQFVLTDNEL